MEALWAHGVLLCLFRESVCAVFQVADDRLGNNQVQGGQGNFDAEHGGSPFFGIQGDNIYVKGE